MSSFSSSLFSIMALSRGETCGLTLHKNKEEIEQKYSRGTVSSWGLYFMCFERKKLKISNSRDLKYFSRESLSCNSRVARCPWAPNEVPQTGTRLLYLSLWHLLLAHPPGSLLRTGVALEAALECLAWMFTIGSDSHFCSQRLNVGVLVSDTEPLSGLNPWCPAQ